MSPQNQTTFASQESEWKFVIMLVVMTCLFSTVRAQGSKGRGPQPSPPQRSRPQEEREISTLEPGRAFDRRINGGESHTYRLELPARQFAKVVAEQQGADLVVALKGPDGARLAEIDSPNGLLGPEAVMVVSASAGSYLIEVSSPGKEAPAGRYKLYLEEWKAAAPTDLDRIKAQSLYSDGRQQLNEGTGDSMRAAARMFEQALPLWQAANDRQREVYTLGFLGTAYDQLSEYQKALDWYLVQLPLARAIHDRVSESNALDNIGSEYYSLGEYAKALDYYEQSLAASQDLGIGVYQAGVYNNIALIYKAQGDPRKAIEYYKRAAALLGTARDQGGGQATILQNIGLAYLSLDEMPTALDYFNQSLRISRARGDRPTESITISNIGALYKTEGELEKALEYYLRALELSRAIGLRRSEALALTNIADVYISLNEGQKALEYLGPALTIWQALNERSFLARTLINTGSAQTLIEDHRKALDYFERAIAILREVSDPSAEASALTFAASAHDSLGERPQAADFYQQALKIWRELKDRRGEAKTLAHLGYTDLALGRIQEAQDDYARSLELSRAVKDRPIEAAALRGLARVAQARGDLDSAREMMEKAVSIMEGVRAGLISPDVRASFFTSVREYYDPYIDLLMRLHRARPGQGYDAAALQVSESARARGLLELLGEARFDLRRGVDGALLERERSLRKQLDARAERLTRLLNGAHTEEQAAELQRQLNELLSQQQQVDAKIRASSPNYVALTRPDPLTPVEIQSRVLGPDTVLLEYALGDERSYLWVVTPDSISSHVLPGRAEVEAAARHLHGLLTAREKRMRFETAEEKRQRVEEADAAFWPAASALSQMILGPAAAQLGRKRLLIVSDGALDYIPFAALPRPLDGGGTGKGGPLPSTPLPLAVEHEIVNLPSASTLAVLRREVRRRSPAPRTLLVFADPVFDSHDARVRSGRKGDAGPSAVARQAASTREEVLRSARETGDPDTGVLLARLPYTRREATELLSLVPTSGRRGALDFDANKALATSAEVARYKFLHFATHGFLNNTHPELSGIVLSLVGPRGESRNGFLRADEVFNLRLHADLVVLSGCQTGLGKELRGEGILGLTRGFIYAGAARVLVSLWGVSDEASAELMARVYKEMLRGEKLRPAAALRAAQLSMLKEKRWQSPYYWAPFVQYGEPE